MSHSGAKARPALNSEPSIAGSDGRTLVLLNCGRFGLRERIMRPITRTEAIRIAIQTKLSASPSAARP